MKNRLLLLISIICIVFILFFLWKEKITLKKVYLSEKYYQEISDFIEVNDKDLKTKKKETYLLYTYNSYCLFPVSCDDIFKEFLEEYKIQLLSISFDEFKKTSFYQKVEYAPSLLIVHKNKVLAYLDANSSTDAVKYQDVEELKTWIEKYIYLEKDN